MRLHPPQVEALQARELRQRLQRLAVVRQLAEQQAQRLQPLVGSNALDAQVAAAIHQLQPELPQAWLQLQLLLSRPGWLALVLLLCRTLGVLRALEALAPAVALRAVAPGVVPRARLLVAQQA